MVIENCGLWPRFFGLHFFVLVCIFFFFFFDGKLPNFIKNVDQHLHHEEEFVQENKGSLQFKQRNQGDCFTNK